MHVLLGVDVCLAGRKTCKHGQRVKPIEQLTRTRRICRLRCDSCLKEFERPGKAQCISALHHFCCWRCKCDAMKSNGVSAVLAETTCLKNHGVKRGFIKPEVLQRSLFLSHTSEAEDRRSASLKAYHASKPEGWKNPGNTPEACAKRHQTMKANGTYRKSSVEDALYEHLCCVYGVDQVIRHVWMNDRWPIDFYVKSTNTYIQLDGVYWHGLDRPIEVIAQHLTNRDAQIHKKWLTDREQDQWFEQQKLNLRRLTDVQFLQGQRP